MEGGTHETTDGKIERTEEYKNAQNDGQDVQNNGPRKGMKNGPRKLQKRVRDGRRKTQRNSKQNGRRITRNMDSTDRGKARKNGRREFAKTEAGTGIGKHGRRNTKMND